MTLILNEKTANANLILRFIGSLEREDYLLCREIKESLKLRIFDNQEIEDLKMFIYSCNSKIENELCLHTAKMLDSLKS